MRGCEATYRFRSLSRGPRRFQRICQEAQACPLPFRRRCRLYKRKPDPPGSKLHSPLYRSRLSPAKPTAAQPAFAQPIAEPILVESSRPQTWSRTASASVGAALGGSACAASFLGGSRRRAPLRCSRKLGQRMQTDSALVASAGQRLFTRDTALRTPTDPPRRSQKLNISEVHFS